MPVVVMDFSHNAIMQDGLKVERREGFGAYASMAEAHRVVVALLTQQIHRDLD